MINNKKHLENSIAHIQKAIDELKKVNANTQDHIYFMNCLENILSSDNGQAGLIKYSKRNS